MYTLTEQQILQFAKISPEVRAYLEQLFPEVFKYDLKKVTASNAGYIPSFIYKESPDSFAKVLIQVYKGDSSNTNTDKTFVLDEFSNWVIFKEEATGLTLLKPTKK